MTGQPRKQRNLIQAALLRSSLYKPKVVKNKKRYNRKAMRKRIPAMRNEHGFST